MFIDEVKINVIAGKGGDGCSSFRREKYVEMGGPDGGNGGKGGDIIFVADAGLKTLIDLRYKKTLKGNRGEHGKGQNRTGRNGEDIKIKVPVGTTVRDADTGLIICDLVKDKEEAIVAKGGKGGRGNLSFKTNKNTAPFTSEYGEDGEEKTLLCELKLLADVGLVGFPSVGKSSIISVISESKPKIADYPFTTLTPNLGVVKLEEGKSYVVADLPGIIEGASEGIGLGDKFLRHIERTKILCHVLDMDSIENRDPYEDYKTILNELEKYSKKIINKPSIIIANKMDLPNAKENLKKLKEKIKDKEIIEISAATHKGINELKYKLGELVFNTEEQNIYEEDEFEDYVLYKFKKEKPFEITKEGNTWVVKGEKIEKLLKKTKFNSNEAEIRFANKLKKEGVDDELEKLGAKEGDTVKILDFEFEYSKSLY